MTMLGKITLLGQPLSTNNLYLTRGGWYGRFMKKNAFALKQSYIRQLRIQRNAKKPIETPVSIVVDIYYGNKREYDWDNVHKLSMDACNWIIWNDDKQIMKATVEKKYDKANPRLEIYIYEYNGK